MGVGASVGVGEGAGVEVRVGVGAGVEVRVGVGVAISPAVTVTVILATYGGFSGVWLLLMSSTEKVCVPGVTLGQV